MHAVAPLSVDALGREQSCSAFSSIPYLSFEDAQVAVEPPADVLLEREVFAFARPPETFRKRLLQRPLYLARTVATPNRETLRFFWLARALGRPALISTMPDDRFTPGINASKRRLAKLPIETGPRALRHVRVVSFDHHIGKPFSQMRCLDGTDFVSFHRRLLASVLGADGVRAALSGRALWRGEPPSKTYPRMYALMTCFGILAESYLFEGAERAFVERVVLPSLDATVARFGRLPRIIRLLPPGEETDPAWEYYPPAALPYALAAAKCMRSRPTNGVG